MNRKASPKSAKSQGGEEAPETDATSEEKTEAKAGKGAEQKLDDVGDKISKAMSEGVKRMEDVFDQGMKNVRENPS